VLWRAGDLELVQGRYAFTVYYGEEELGRVHLGLAGQHNVANALAVIALANDCGVPWPKIQAALGEFQGAQRRLELRGVLNGIRVVDDYAHHPTEIQATLQAARERFEPRQLWCVFQPHQHSRTRFLMDHFAESFSFADRVVVPDIFFVRDSERDREAVQATDLVGRIQQRGVEAEYIPSFSEIVEHIAAEAAPGDIVITMGAGNVWKVADELLHRLGGRLSD
jgi:UDP-N-acetylmuramate--alanine ligase